MQTVSAYRAEDGSLHETREAAAQADLIALGFLPQVATEMLDRRKDIERVYRQVSGLSHIPVYYPDANDGRAA